MTTNPTTTTASTVPSAAVATGEPTTAPVAQPDPVARFLADIAAGTGAFGPDVLSPDVVLDATVPNWRLEAVGDEAVRAQFASFYADPTAFDAVRRRPVPGGEAVEIDMTWVEDGIPHASHQLHLLEIEHGRIRRDTMFCGGRWPAALLAEMEAARVQ